MHGLPARQRCSHMDVFHKRGFVSIFTRNTEKIATSLETHISVDERLSMRFHVLTPVSRHLIVYDVTLSTGDKNRNLVIIDVGLHLSG